MPLELRNTSLITRHMIFSLDNLSHPELVPELDSGAIRLLVEGKDYYRRNSSGKMD